MGRFGTAGFLIACALAALAPLRPQPRAGDDSATFPGWPETFDGSLLRPRPLAARERRFAADFPGRIATFGDGRRLYVVRWVTRATRQLHPAADCYRGAGYAIAPRPLLHDAQGRAWATFIASRGSTRLHVRERIVAASGGDIFTDASSWYWAALLGGADGPWWAWTVVEADAAQAPGTLPSTTR